MDTRTYKVICEWTRSNFDKQNKKYIPSSVKFLLLQFIGIYYFEIKIAKTVKAVFVGDTGVGKTSIIERFVKGIFSEYRESTIGAAFCTQSIKIQPYNEIIFQLWDTAGRERFHSLAPLYWRGAQVAFIVFDLTEITTFERGKHWLNECYTMRLDENVIVCIVGNKTDLCDPNTEYKDNESFLRYRHRQIEKEDVIKFINGRNIYYWEISAKTGQCVKDMFEDVANKLCETFRATNDKNIMNENGIKLVKPKDFTQNNGYGCYC
eukprot:90496_1